MNIVWQPGFGASFFGGLVPMWSVRNPPSSNTPLRVILPLRFTGVLEQGVLLYSGKQRFLILHVPWEGLERQHHSPNSWLPKPQTQPLLGRWWLSFWGCFRNVHGFTHHIRPNVCKDKLSSRWGVSWQLASCGLLFRSVGNYQASDSVLSIGPHHQIWDHQSAYTNCGHRKFSTPRAFHLCSDSWRKLCGITLSQTSCLSRSPCWIETLPYPP